MEFNVLETGRDLKAPLFLEASAGTGKTFAIEHGVIRLLLEGMPLHSILIITFTKEATSELKERIRNALEKAEQDLLHNTGAPYLYRGEKELFLTLLQNARRAFDEASIYTIHGFCYKMLLENLLEAPFLLDLDPEEASSTIGLLKPIQDLFENHFFEGKILPSSQKMLLHFFKGDSLFLYKKLAEWVALPALVPNPLELNSGLEALGSLKTHFHGALQEDLEGLGRFYKGILDKQKKVKPEIQKAYAALKLAIQNPSLETLDLFLMKGEPLLKAFGDIKANTTPILPLFWEKFQKTVPVFEKFSDISALLLSMVSYIKKEGTYNAFSPDEILFQFEKMLQKPALVLKIQKKFQAAIIDEFQDTDALQWSILKTLFYQKGHFPLYLVGDPKQSIYGFRRADLYTYFQAKASYPQEFWATLETNYRSAKNLVEALNTLFDFPLMDLPKRGEKLPIPPVKASFKTSEEQKPLIWMGIKADVWELKTKELIALETQFFFPAIALEIQSLQLEIPLEEIAILVRDRYQGQRLEKYLSEKNIPCVTQKTKTLSQSEALIPLQELLRAVMNPKKSSYRRQALMGKIMGMSPLEILHQENYASLFAEWSYRLRQEGLSSFFHAFLHEKWGETSFYASLVQREGPSFYLELFQLIELLLGEETKGSSLDEILLFLEEVASPFSESDPRFFALKLKEGVQIMSLHMSKGLEFDAVFALGVMSPTPSQELVMFQEKEGELFLAPFEPSLLSEREKFSEKMREFYVGLTRAKKRLYVPWLEVDSPFEPNAASSALSLYSYRSGLKKKEELLALSPHMEYRDLTRGLSEVQGILERKIPSLIPPTPLIKEEHPLWIQSFSSLCPPLEALKLSSPPSDFHPDLFSPHTLPAGPQTGALLHTLLEKPSLLDETLKGTPYIPFREVIQNLIQKTFKTPLTSPYGTFTLEEVAVFIQEMEFQLNLDSPKTIQGIRLEKGVLKGFMDLIFEKEGRYYIVDYKSNWLGESPEAYDHLEKVMQEHHYTLQASLYAMALKEYLELYNISFESSFGGVFYLFLRGLDAKTSRGVYYFKPSLEC